MNNVQNIILVISWPYIPFRCFAKNMDLELPVVFKCHALVICGSSVWIIIAIFDIAIPKFLQKTCSLLPWDIRKVRWEMGIYTTRKNISEGNGIGSLTFISASSPCCALLFHKRDSNTETCLCSKLLRWSSRPSYGHITVTFAVGNKAHYQELDSVCELLKV
jgi:hypothetical protein